MDGINFKIEKNSFIISADDEARKELRELKDLDKREFNSDNTMCDILEQMNCNTEYQFNTLDQLGHMSEAPCYYLIDTENDNGEVLTYSDLFYYDNYMITSIQNDLLEYGKCIFKKANV